MLAPPARGEEGFDYEKALRDSLAAVGRTMGDHPFRDVNGQAVSLAQYRGKPLVISLVYTSCFNICSMTTRNLHQVADSAWEVLGRDAFQVVTIGFDTRNDTPAAMAAFARQQEVAGLPRWSLLSGEQTTVDALARELGFLYFPTSKGFDHLVQATVVDGEGKVYRQVYGEVFDPPQLIEPLKDLALGRPQPDHTTLDDIVRRVRFFCTVYDPTRGIYRFDYSLFVGLFIGGTIILLGLWMVLREWRRR